MFNLSKEAAVSRAKVMEVSRKASVVEPHLAPSLRSSLNATNTNLSELATGPDILLHSLSSIVTFPSPCLFHFAEARSIWALYLRLEAPNEVNISGPLRIRIGDSLEQYSLFSFSCCVFPLSA